MKTMEQRKIFRDMVYRNSKNFYQKKENLKNEELNILRKIEKRRTRERVKNILSTIKGKKQITIDYIQKIVCEYFNLTIEQLHFKTRKREIVQARQIAMYFSKNLTKSSLATIGSKIGGKVHATVLHACKTVNNLSETDKKFRFQIEDLEKKLTCSKT